MPTVPSSGAVFAFTGDSAEPALAAAVGLGAVTAWLREADATLVALDLHIDTSTADGRHVGATLIALSTHRVLEVPDEFEGARFVHPSKYPSAHRQRTGQREPG
jgi:hypothetical protein